jgi:hypothetical protein
MNSTELTRHNDLKTRQFGLFLRTLCHSKLILPEVLPDTREGETHKLQRLALELVRHPALERYSISEARAIICHYFYLRYRSPIEKSLEEVINDWESGGCKRWRKAKMRLDSRHQLRAIARHARRLGQERGSTVALEEAACDWIEKHAKGWREAWEKRLDSTPMIFPYFLFNFFSSRDGACA